MWLELTYFFDLVITCPVLLRSRLIVQLTSMVVYLFSDAAIAAANSLELAFETLFRSVNLNEDLFTAFCVTGVRDRELFVSLGTTDAELGGSVAHGFGIGISNFARKVELSKIVKSSTKMQSHRQQVQQLQLRRKVFEQFVMYSATSAGTLRVLRVQTRSALITCVQAVRKSTRHTTTVVVWSQPPQPRQRVNSSPRDFVWTVFSPDT